MLWRLQQTQSRINTPGIASQDKETHYKNKGCRIQGRNTEITVTGLGGKTNIFLLLYSTIQCMRRDSDPKSTVTHYFCHFPFLCLPLIPPSPMYRRRAFPFRNLHQQILMVKTALCLATQHQWCNHSHYHTQSIWPWSQTCLPKYWS